MSREKDPGQWWTEAWSPVTGCTSAGAGCDHCWARAMVRRFPALHDIPLHPTPFSTVVCHRDRLDKPLRWRKPRVVLVSMLGDLFHEQVPKDFIDRVFARCVRPHHFALLTKRWGRAVEHIRSLPEEPWVRWLEESILMASVWDQPSADAACAAFASLPAGVRWGLHVEPMLGPVDLPRHQDIPGGPATVRASWIVCGGENGPGARPMDPQWALDLREQCRAAGVPFWWKGPGSWLRGESTAGDGGWLKKLGGLEQTREVPW